jgi:hypothetical protein
MKKIQAFEADDGFVDKDPRKVEDHEKELAIKSLFNKFVDSHARSGMGKADICEMLWENRNELIGEIAKIESINKKQ